jgi:hypothetical protein
MPNANPAFCRRTGGLQRPPGKVRTGLQALL